MCCLRRTKPKGPFACNDNGINKLKLSITSRKLASFGMASPVASLKSAPAGFSFNGRAAPDIELKMIIGMKQNNINGLKDRILDISSPTSNNYRKWLTREQVRHSSSILYIHILTLNRDL